MAIGSSQSVLRQVHRLFNVGAIGGMTDTQLLDGFESRRAEAAEAAFEELVFRHGPMVFRVCRSVLRDTHDAEDAFQAVFLVLAYRAKSIRRRGSLASWLFGVAHRVASRARTTAASRRARDARVAVRTTESYVSAEECHDDAILHEEINRLPEGLRSLVTLCYLEGLTYKVAAHRLGLSETVVRGRLARARERLRRRLTARGVTVPVGMLIAGTAGQTQAAIPTSLVHSTVRIALGFAAGKTASVLARGVLNAMLLNQLKVASVLLLLGIGGRYCAWNAFAGLIDDKGQAEPVVAKTPAAVPASAPKSQIIPPTLQYRLIGTVRVEGTGEPVAGAKLQIQTGDLFEYQGPDQKPVESGADGRFVVELPAGRAEVWLAEPPIGYYWVSGDPHLVQSFSVGPDEPVIHREFRMRKGTIWDFQLMRGADRKPFPGFVSGYSLRSREQFVAQADDTGQMRVTLPSESRGVNLYVQESSSSLSSSRFDTGFLFLRLEWEANFRPDELQQISLLEGKVRGFRLVDANEKSATLQAAAPIEPVNENGRLVIRAAVPDRDSKDFGAVTGQVLDQKDRPIAGVRVGLAATKYRISNELRHLSTTNAEGRYRLRDIPRQRMDGEPSTFQIVVAKEGYAGFVSPPLTLNLGTTEKLQVVDPIRLEPGVAVSGIVVDHRGRPVAGARVRTNKPVPHGGLSENLPTVRTDDNGRFTMHDLQRGMTELTADDGITFTVSRYVRAGTSQSVFLQLSEQRPRHDVPLIAQADPSNPLRRGQAALEWQTGLWSDGRLHTLADDRRKVIVLYFWGTDFWQSVSALPALGKLASQFEPRGVVFRAIHRPDRDEKRTAEEARRVLALKKAPLTFALDQVRIERHSRGMTAQAYGVPNYPVVIVIDHAGKIAFRSDMTAGDHNMAGVFMQILTDPQAMTEEKANQLVERAISEEIESVLK